MTAKERAQKWYARDVSCGPDIGHLIDAFEAHAKEARAEEREAIAKMVEGLGGFLDAEKELIAKAIRERGL